MTTHPTAIIEDGARIGDGVEIGPFCVVGPRAVLSDGVRLVSHVSITGNTQIGARTIVYPQAVLGGPAQMRSMKPSDERLVIGTDNVIREGVSISTGSHVGHGTTTVGNNNYLMAFSHIGHDCQVGNNVTLSNGVLIAGHVEIGDGVIMGGLAAAQQFGRIGRYSFISGLSGVSTDVIPYGIAIGLHVRLGGLNLIGLRRRGIPRPNIQALRAAYRAIFMEGRGSIQDNARDVQDKWADVPEVREMIAFILADAKRPICPARRRGADSGDDES